MQTPEKIVLTNAVKNIKKTSFGLMLDFDIPKKFDAVILCYNINGSGLQPYSLRLPHQIYLEDFVSKIAELEKFNCKISFTLIPIKAKNYIQITE